MLFKARRHKVEMHYLCSIHFSLGLEENETWFQAGEYISPVSQKPQDQWKMGFITNVCICIIKVFRLTPKKQQKIGNGWDLHREAVIKVMKLTKARIVENKSLLYTSDGSFHESSHPRRLEAARGK